MSFQTPVPFQTFFCLSWNKILRRILVTKCFYFPLTLIAFLSIQWKLVETETVQQAKKVVRVWILCVFGISCVFSKWSLIGVSCRNHHPAVPEALSLHPTPCRHGAQGHHDQFTRQIHFECHERPKKEQHSMWHHSEGGEHRFPGPPHCVGSLQWLFLCHVHQWGNKHPLHPHSSPTYYRNHCGLNWSVLLTICISKNYKDLN